MAISNFVYRSFLEDLGDNTVDLENDTFKVCLVSGTYTPAHTHTTYADVTDEVVGTGYTAGGTTLAGIGVTLDTGDDEGVWDATDTVWSGSTFTTGGCVIYSTTNSNSLVACFTFNGDQSPSGADFTIQWNSEGILNINHNN